jgi:uncharacterized delta-60 repeat protein
MVRRSIGLTGVIAGVLLVLGVGNVAAGPVRIDAGFGEGGIARTSLPPHYEVEGFGEVVARGNGGVTVAAGYSLRKQLSFDASGVLTGTAEGDEGAALQPTEAATADGGRVVVAPGSTRVGWALPEVEGKVARYASDESPVASFGDGGTVSNLPFFPEALAALPSGKVLLAGQGVYTPGGVKTRPVTEVDVARLDSDGSLDPSFGAMGIVRLRGAFKVSDTEALHIQAHGGEGAEVVTPTTVVALDAAGGLDPSFGEGGKVTTLGRVVGAGTAPGERLLIAGTMLVGPAATTEPGYRAEHPKREEFYVARYGPDGRLDQGFAGGSGIAVLRPQGAVGADSAMFEADGSTLIGGSVTPPTPGCPLYYNCDATPTIARFTPSGQPDPGFGQGGLLRLEALAVRGGERYVGIRAFAPRPAGGVFVAGESARAGFVAALGSDGALLAGFGEGGIATYVETKTPQSAPAAVGFDRAGSIYVAAETTSGTGNGAAVIRYEPDGKIDIAYGEDGEAFVAAGPRAIAVAPDGTAFTVTHEIGPLPTLTKVTPTGTLDPDFGKNGTAFFPFPPYRYEPEAVVRLAGGGVLVAGNLEVKNTERPTLVRFLPSGKVDPKFGKRGVEELRLGRHRTWYAHTVTVDGKGRLLLGGGAQRVHHQGCCREEAALVRLGANGTLDRGFGRQGSVLFQPGEISVAGEISTRGGRIVALTYGGGKQRWGQHLFAFSSNGRPERGFGHDGEVPVTRSPHGNVDSGGRESELGMFVTGRRILVLKSSSLLSFSLGGHLQRANSPRLPQLLPNRQREDVSPWGPAATLDGNGLVVAWAAIPRTHEGKGVPAEVNLRRVLVGRAGLR